jgi:hypothetical protein
MGSSTLSLSSAGTTAGLLRSMEQNAAVGTKLLKKTMEADKDMISQLLPLPQQTGGRLDIRA